MNETDREQLYRLVGGIAEVKATLVATNMHLENMNGNVAKHFKDDLVWQAEHDQRVAQADGFRKGVMVMLTLCTSSVAAIFLKVVMGVL